MPIDFLFVLAIAIRFEKNFFAVAALILSRIHHFFGRWVSLLTMVFFLSACSHQTNEVTTVTLSGWQSNPTETQLIKKVLADFEAKYPLIKVEFEVITEPYMDVIKTRLIGDAAPDVFYLEAFEAPLLMSSNVLEPLNGYIKKNFDLADFQTFLLDAFKEGDKLYGLPKDFSTLALFYNPQLFKKANLISPPKTWQQLQEYSQKLTVDLNNDGRKDRYGFGIKPDLARQYVVMKAFGSQLVNRKGYAIFANSKSFQGLKEIIFQYQKYRTAAQPSDVGASSESEMFGQEKAAMVIEGSWAIPSLKETFPELKFATAEIPLINNRKSTMAYTVAYVMNKQAKHKDAAWKLIEYLTGKEGMKTWAKGGAVLPSRKSVLLDLGYTNNSLYLPFIKGATYATIWKAGINLPTIRIHFNNQFLSAFLGNKSVREALKKAQKDANEEIREANY
jgi:multiple sugar transport system substrate-binding protein